MKLSKFTDYNLRVLIYLALNDDRLCTIQEIATAYQISENHLMSNRRFYRAAAKAAAYNYHARRIKSIWPM